MSDRELLGLAAKAAGFGDDEGRTTWTESEYPRRSGKRGALWNFIGHMDTAELWNPLTDDGDALRLAVTLKIEPKWPFTGEAWAVKGDALVIEDCGSDIFSATRRAIVRAAAEIGRTL